MFLSTLNVTRVMVTIYFPQQEDNYDHPEIFMDAGPIREMIFRLFMRLRANDALHLGVENEDGVVRFDFLFFACS
jgi:hypothetical protein